jgi:hypothetical protein
MGMGGQLHVPAALPPGKIRGWAPKPVWTGAENLTPPGFYPRVVLPVESCCTHYTIPARTGTVRVGFMVDKMTVGRVSLQVQQLPDLRASHFRATKVTTKIFFKKCNSYYSEIVIKILFCVKFRIVLTVPLICTADRLLIVLTVPLICTADRLLI